MKCIEVSKENDEETIWRRQDTHCFEAVESPVPAAAAAKPPIPATKPAVSRSPAKSPIGAPADIIRASSSSGLPAAATHRFRRPGIYSISANELCRRRQFPAACTAASPRSKSYDSVFRAWDQGTGFINGTTALEVFAQSGLDKGDLARIWTLADIDDRGKLNLAEFHVAMGLIYRKLNGNESPDQLPPELVPPSSRQLGESVDLVCDLLKHALPLNNTGSAGNDPTRDAANYRHSDPTSSAYKPTNRHVDRDARTLANTASMLDRAAEAERSRTAEDDALEAEMSDLKRKVARINEDLKYASRGPRSAAKDDERRKLERELLELMHVRVPEVERRIKAREERKDRERREGVRDRDRIGATSGLAGLGTATTRDRYERDYRRDDDRDRPYSRGSYSRDERNFDRGSYRRRSHSPSRGDYDRPRSAAPDRDFDRPPSTAPHRDILVLMDANPVSHGERRIFRFTSDASSLAYPHGGEAIALRASSVRDCQLWMDGIEAASKKCLEAEKRPHTTLRGNSVAAEPGNQWFATGAGDRVIKIWDLASGELKLSLTGHISTVRGPAVSLRHPYLFSCDGPLLGLGGEQDHYHGHLSGVYALSLHPTLDILVTAGRDASARVWDMRTKAQIHVLSGPTATVADVKCQESEPQVIMITGSMDSTVRLWDLAAGKTRVTLTHHKKSVRVLAIHPTEYSSASGLAGDNNIKKWKCPDGAFVFNSSGYNAIINTLSVNAEGVFSGADNGSLAFWDYNTGTSFQNMEDVPQPGSLEAEAGVYCSTFDMTGTRLITGGADKTIKIYAEQSE
ncbi:WD40-repeat-containing domain protein [Mycena vitilis]|nr:WD40-repeat-containing domain protein [Mycena vitilis]